MSDFPIIVFCDGASKGNPGPGGWGVVSVTPDGSVTELGGADTHTTNNRMELTAAINAVGHLADAPGRVEIYTDSTYVIKGISEWIWAWRRRPVIAFGILFMYLAHAVESGIIPIPELAFEHRTYLPNLGLCLVAAWLLSVEVPRRIGVESAASEKRVAREQFAFAGRERSVSGQASSRRFNRDRRDAPFFALRCRGQARL